MAKAKRGFCATVGAAAGFGSVDGVIGFWLALRRSALGFRSFFLVENGIGDDVFFGGPVAKVEQPAALAAEGEFSVAGRIRGLFADGADVFHGQERVLPQSPQASTGLSEVLAQDPKGRAGGDAGELLYGRGRRNVRQRTLRRARKNFNDAADKVIGVSFGESRRHELKLETWRERKIS